MKQELFQNFTSIDSSRTITDTEQHLFCLTSFDSDIVFFTGGDEFRVFSFKSLFYITERFLNSYKFPTVDMKTK